MAETPDTPETPEPEAPETEAPEAEAPEAETAEPAPAETEADAPVAEAAGAAPPARPQQPQLSPRERKAAARDRRGRRRGSTPEERVEIRAAKATARRRRREQERAKRAKAGKGEGTPPAEHGTGTPQVRLGKVVSDKADKTITVRIDIARRHRRYRKIVRSSMTLHAHDERNDAHAGDLVRVVESRPMSRTKRWRLVEVLERAR
jgi:small subunit ribosomal protein S17